MVNIDKNNIQTKNDENILQLRFSEEFDFKNLPCYEKAVRIWQNIFTTFATITQQKTPAIEQNPEQAENERQITIALSETLLHSIVEAYTSLLELKNNQLRLENAINEIKLLIGDCEYFSNFVAEQHEQLKMRYIIEATEWLMLNYYNGNPDDFDKKYEMLHVAIEQLFSFIEKKGIIDFSYANMLTTTNDNQQLQCA